MTMTEPGMDRFNQPGWTNLVWTGPHYRRAHVDVVDARAYKGLWMMHCCIFPHLHNPAPIFGFDVIAGENKMTGCFYDFSPAGDPEHPLLEWFADESQKLSWNKTRKLPDWAERIFSVNMVAAGNVQEEQEIDQIVDMAVKGLHHYLDHVGKTNHTANDTREVQNYYAQNQKQNPHTPRVMTSLGLSEDDVRVFIQDCLFPEI
jgi:phycocyanobilin:ferredoxin oxidoreductase